MHVDIGTLQNTPRKIKIIVGLLQVMEIMLEVHGVIHLGVGEGVKYQYVEASKLISIHTYTSGVKQMLIIKYLKILVN